MTERRKMEKILIIGGAGYIGSHVAKAFLDNGYRVRVFDNFSTGQKINLFPQAEFVEGDISDYELLKNAMIGINGVVHLAAKKAVSESMENPNLYSFNNLSGSIDIICAMEEMGVKNIVFSSSAAVYGIPEYLPIDENHPQNPINYYGFAKLEIEKILAWYDNLKGIKFAALRYFNAVGYDASDVIKGRESGVQNLLPIIAEVLDGKRDCLKVFGTDYDTPDGTCVRDYVHVSDLADAHVLALKKLFDGHHSMTLNLGTGNGTSVKEIIEAVNKVLNINLNVKYEVRRPGDPASLYASGEKARQILGWEPKYLDIEEIIKTCF